MWRPLKYRHRQAKKYDMSRYKVIEGRYGWRFLKTVYVGKEDHWNAVGRVGIANDEWGWRGECPDLATAQKFVSKHRGNHSAYYEES